MSDSKLLQILLEGQQTMRKEMKEGFDKVNSRIDSLGASLAYLEDDTPTREEYNHLEKRVVKIEKKLNLT